MNLPLSHNQCKLAVDKLHNELLTIKSPEVKLCAIVQATLFLIEELSLRVDASEQGASK